MEKTNEIKLSKHGNYLYGILDGVEPKDDNNWINNQGQTINTKAHLQLTFILNTEIKKEIQGREIISIVPRKQIIQVPVPSTELLKEYDHFEKLNKKDLLIGYSVTDNFKVKIELDDIVDLSNLKPTK